MFIVGGVVLVLELSVLTCNGHNSCMWPDLQTGKPDVEGDMDLVARTELEAGKG